MFLNVRSDLLRDGFNKILSIVNKKNNRPILNNCLIKTKGPNSLELIATDLEIFIRIRVEANIQGEGEFCISAKNFTEILREMPNDQLALTVDNSKKVLNLECKEIKFSLVIVDKNDFPDKVFKHVEEEGIQIPAKQFQDIINKTIHAVSLDESRAFFNGIFLQQISTRLRAVATDGHRLALFDILDFEMPNEFLVEGILIPRKGINEIKKMVDTFPNEMINVVIDESFIHLSIQNKYLLSIRLIIREFPKYQSVIPNKTTYSFKFDKNLLSTSVKRVRVLASERFNGVRFQLEDKFLTIMANNPSYGDARERILIEEYDGPLFEIGFNADFIIDALSVFDQGDVFLEFNNELSPIILRSMDLPEFLSVIMPLKL